MNNRFRGATFIPSCCGNSVRLSSVSRACCSMPTPMPMSFACCMLVAQASFGINCMPMRMGWNGGIRVR
jgi:hypothetical protein